MLHELTSLVLPLLPEFDLPPLPPIVNEHLARLVVTHSSFHSEPKQATSLELKRSNPTDNYEKLEHVGDALLGAVATTVLQDLYADLPPGTATVRPLISQLMDRSSSPTLSTTEHWLSFACGMVSWRPLSLLRLLSTLLACRPRSKPQY